YFIYTTYSWNLDAQLSAVRALYTNHHFSLEKLLSDYPNLLTFATTNELNLAKGAFSNAVTCYLAGSQFIRSRPTNTIRMFNFNGSRSEGEARFRSILTDLRTSLTNGPVRLA